MTLKTMLPKNFPITSHFWKNWGSVGQKWRFWPNSILFTPS